MKRRNRRILAAFVLVTVLGIGAVVVFLALPWSARDHMKLQGSWVGDGVRLTFDGDVATYEGPARSPDPCYFKLEPNASPKRIILWPVGAPGLGNPKRVLGFKVGPPKTGDPNWQMRGIYEISGNTLKLRLSQPGSDFPAELEAGEYMTFMRE